MSAAACPCGSQHGGQPGAHVVTTPSTGASVDGVCLHCGDRFRLGLPAMLRVVAGCLDVFAEAHRACEPRPPAEVGP